MKENNFISVILYCHNLDKSVINTFPEKLYQNFLIHFKNYEIIVVNDTEQEQNIERLTEGLSKYAEHNTITVIKFPSFAGVEAAMIAGNDLTVGDYIFEFDNLNIQFGDSLLMDVYETMMKGYDIVSAGSPKIKKSLAAKTFYKIYNSGVKSEQNIQSEVFRLVSRRAYNRAKAMTKTMAYRKAVYASAGLKRYFIEDKSICVLRNHDKKEVDNRFSLGIDSLMIFTNIIQRFSVFVSCLFLLITIIISGYIIGIFLLSKPVAGWTPIMMYLSIGFFGIFALLALILKYLSVILSLVYKKETHMIESLRKV